MRDASLDEFVDGEGDADDGVGVAPARATSTFDPAGGECDSCDDRVERLWRDGDALVCGACKEW